MSRLKHRSQSHARRLVAAMRRNRTSAANANSFSREERTFATLYTIESGSMLLGNALRVKEFAPNQYTILRRNRGPSNVTRRMCLSCTAPSLPIPNKADDRTSREATLICVGIINFSSLCIFRAKTVPYNAPKSAHPILYRKKHHVRFYQNKSLRYERVLVEIAIDLLGNTLRGGLAKY